MNNEDQLASTHVPVQNLNAGLQDQHAVLQFLQKNLHSLGGDPKKVCILGVAYKAIAHECVGDNLGPGKRRYYFRKRAYYNSPRLMKSAGAGSAESHVLFPFPQTLFRAVISDSSTGPL